MYANVAHVAALLPCLRIHYFAVSRPVCLSFSSQHRKRVTHERTCDAYTPTRANFGRSYTRPPGKLSAADSARDDAAARDGAAGPNPTSPHRGRERSTPPFRASDQPHGLIWYTGQHDERVEA